MLTGGVEAYVDGVSSTAENPDTAGNVKPKLLSLYPDGAAYGSYGIFVQDEMRFGRLSLTAGARYSLVAMDFVIPRDTALALAFGSVDRKFHAFTGSLGAAYTVIPGFVLVGNLSQGFRAPNLSDVARTGESKTTTSGNTRLEEPVSGIPPIFGLTGLRWAARNYTLYGFLRFALKQDRLSTEDRTDARITLGGTPGGTPGWYALTLRGQCRLRNQCARAELYRLGRILPVIRLPSSNRKNPESADMGCKPPATTGECNPPLHRHFLRKY